MSENKDLENFGQAVQKAFNITTLISSFQTVADNLKTLLSYVATFQKYGELFLNFLISMNPELKAIRDSQKSKGSFDFYSFFSNEAVLNTVSALISAIFGSFTSLFKGIPGQKDSKPLILSNIEMQIELLRQIQKAIEENSIKPEELQKFLAIGAKEGSIAALETLPGHLKNAMRTLKITSSFGQENEI